MQAVPSSRIGRFGRSERLAGKPAFARVLASRNRLQAGRFALLFSRNEGPAARLGISVAKRFVKQAVSRNRIKRLIREIFRLHPVRIHALDLFVTLRSAPAAARQPLPIALLREELTELMQKAAAVANR